MGAKISIFFISKNVKFALYGRIGPGKMDGCDMLNNLIFNPSHLTQTF